jgi:rhamnulokinase
VPGRPSRAVTVVAAVDFGASSIRVARVDLDATPVAVEVVHRREHIPVPDGQGGLRWAWDRLVAEAEHGLTLAKEKGPLASIGVDTWGVDYGLIDRRGRLVSPPHCYRSPRTAGYKAVVAAIGERPLYERTGLHLQPFTTLFQLAAHDKAELGQARWMLLLPDLLIRHLTGALACERTIAGTSGLVDIATGRWVPELLDVAGLREDEVAPITRPGTPVGHWHGVPVHLVGAHDSASAVAAMPAGAGRSPAFVATGTWFVVGREQAAPDTSHGRQVANFTNEPAVGGGIRLRKNLAGFGLLDECRRGWGDTDTATLLGEAAAVTEGYRTFDATEPRFLAPADMEAEVREAAAIDAGASRATVVRAIVASLAETSARVVADGLAGTDELALLGGGAGSDLLRAELARRSGLPVRSGPTEAAVVGNALVQGVALGRFASLADARAHVG